MMIKCLIALILIMSSSLFAQSNRPNKKSFDCQISRYSCNSNLETVTVRTYNYNMAVKMCEARSSRRDMNFCGVIGSSSYPGNTSGTANSYEYRCQLAKSFCGYNGGRYGVWVDARSEYQAKRKCEIESQNRGDLFCRISDVRANTQYGVRRYTCKIAVRSCARTRNSYVDAVSFESARNKCNSVARRSGNRLCEVRRR